MVQAIADDPAIESVTTLDFLNDVSLGPDPVMTAVIVDSGLHGGTGDGVVMIEGRAPIARDEVALGAVTAGRYGVRVGEQVEIAFALFPGAPIETTTATVTGLTVFPTLGPFEANRVSAGNGLLVPEALLGAPGRFSASFVGVELAPGADAAAERAVVERLRSVEFEAPLIFEAPVRPSEIVGAGATRSLPAAIAAVFAVSGAVALAAATWSTARARRHQLAVLRSLGFTTHQVRRSVITQAVCTAVAAAAIGLPLGLITGRTVWRLFADELGVLVENPVTAATVVALTVGIVGSAAIAAIPTAIRATRDSPAADLATE